MFRNLTPKHATPAVPPLHYQHCREDVRWTGYADDALPVVAAAEQGGVSVWKALAAADIEYYRKLLIARLWADKGRGPEADRQEFYS